MADWFDKNVPTTEAPPPQADWFNQNAPAPVTQQTGYVGRGEFAPEAGAKSAPIVTEQAHDPLAQVAAGVFGRSGIAGMIPTSLSDAVQMLTIPRQSDPAYLAEQQQQSEAWGENVRGEHGLEAQAGAITGTALQAAPLLHLPFAESPLRATPRDLALVEKFRPTLTDNLFGEPSTEKPLTEAIFGKETPSVPETTEAPATPTLPETTVGEAAKEIAPQEQVADTGTRPAVPVSTEGEAPQGFVRLYHGSSADSPQAGRDFTTSRQYAEDYAAKAEGGAGGKVWYVDVPEGSLKTHDEYGQPMTRVVVPDEVANQAKPVSMQGEPSTAQGNTKEVTPTSETPTTRSEVTQEGQATPETAVEPTPSTETTGIAERYREEEQPGSVIPGAGVTPEQARLHGQEFINNGGDPYMAVRRAQAGNTSWRDVGVARAEYERLGNDKRAAENALEQDPNNPQLQEAFNKADDLQRKWSKDAQPILTRAGDALRAATRSYPREINSFSDFTDIVNEHYKGDVELTPKDRADLQKAVRGIKDANEGATVARNQVTEAVTKKAGGKIMSFDDLKADLKSTVEQLLEDCPV